MKLEDKLLQWHAHTDNHYNQQFIVRLESCRNSSTIAYVTHAIYTAPVIMLYRYAAVPSLLVYYVSVDVGQLDMQQLRTCQRNDMLIMNANECPLLVVLL